jgi:hypothetical protein
MPVIMKSLIFLLLLALAGCTPMMQPFPPAPLPQSPAKGWKNGTLGEGCTLVKVRTHYEKKCKTDKPGDKPFLCWAQNDALRCKQIEASGLPTPIDPEDEALWQQALLHPHE